MKFLQLKPMLLKRGFSCHNIECKVIFCVDGSGFAKQVFPLGGYISIYKEKSFIAKLKIQMTDNMEPIVEALVIDDCYIYSRNEERELDILSKLIQGTDIEKSHIKSPWSGCGAMC